MTEMLFLTSDVAKAAGVTGFTVHHWSKKGLLPVAFVTPGRVRLFDPTTVRRFLANRKKGRKR